MKIKLKELLDNRYDARWVVSSYYDSRLAGLEDEIYTDDWEEVKDYAHSFVSDGGYVKIVDQKTGVEKVLDYDTYFGEDGENFNGEFPLSVTDFDPNYFNKEESMLKEGDTYFYNTKHTPDSVYWYSTKHGFGPGAFPSGATVLDVVEDDENPYKIYIATDKLLNTKALNDFDLKEERPKDETRFSTKDFTNMHFTGKRKVDNFESKKIKESKETAIKTKVVPVEWDKNNKKKVYSFGDKDPFGKALWYDDEGNAYELIYARKANAYSLNPYPYYNKQK